MYAKVFAQMYDGTLVTKGPWQALVTFQQLLVLADKDGAVDMTAEAISRRTTIPLEIIEKGIEVLLQPDPESRTPTEGGRRIVPLREGRSWGWLVVNYGHYRDLKREEDRREYHRAYWHKRKLNDSTPTQHAQPNQPIADTEAKAETLTPPHPPTGGAFAEFWKSWPAHKRKVARRQCAAKWEALGCDALAPRIMAALAAAKASPDWAKEGGEFIPAPLVWLNQCRWEAPTAAEALATDPWATRAGVEAQAALVGLPKWEQMEAFDVYRRRVRDAVAADIKTRALGALKRVA